nr:MAG TPA: hypothetical protein [Caudoviricetes sp.]
MKLDGLALVFKVVEDKDGRSVTAEFVKDGKGITYSDVSIQDKYNFCMTCKNFAGALANIILMETKPKNDKQQKETEKKCKIYKLK